MADAEPISLVIPGRNCAATIRQCLSSVAPLIDQGVLREIIFVDDGSTDDTANIVREFPVTCLKGQGRGPAAARNVGWRHAQTPLVWFIDSDCVAEPDALALLLPQMRDAVTGGVSGSYGNMNTGSLLACLIHEEIIERHQSMPKRVDFLATFNVLYRRAILEELSGFHEGYIMAEDAEFSFRVMDAGYELRFVGESRVKHFHNTRWSQYLRTQRRQGYWRVFLHLSHSGHDTGDSYSSLLDHMQPLVAVLTLLIAPLVLVELPVTMPLSVPVGLVILLVLAQVPMTLKLVRRMKNTRYVCFGIMGFLRSYWRGVGMVHGVFAKLRSGRGGPPLRGE